MSPCLRAPSGKQLGLHVAAVAGNVGRLENSRYHHHPLGARIEDALQIFPFDAADAKDGELDQPVDFCDVRQTDGWASGLGGCCKQGTEADVVGALLDGALGEVEVPAVGLLNFVFSVFFKGEGGGG